MCSDPVYHRILCNSSALRLLGRLARVSRKQQPLRGCCLLQLGTSCIENAGGNGKQFFFSNFVHVIIR